MNAVRVAVQASLLGLRRMLVRLTSARLRWCVVCGRIGLWGWQPLCAAMPITWVCTDRARCRSLQVLQAHHRERAWRRLAVQRRPGPTRPLMGRPGRPVVSAGAVAVPNLAVCAEEQPADPTVEPPVLVRPGPGPDSAGAGRGGEWR
jgi:hypothetical protein